MSEPHRLDSDEILMHLFQAAISGDAAHYARGQGIDPALLPMWREQYHTAYVAFLENILRVIKDRVDEWPF